MKRRIMNGMILGVVVGLVLVMAGEVAVARADSGDEARPSWEDRVFVNVSGGYQTATPNFAYVDNVVWFEEMATAEVDFEGSSSSTFEIGGGVRLLGNFGFGAAYTRYSGEQTASLTASIPHPIFWDSYAVGELSVPTKRTESVIHLQALYMIPVTRKLQVAVFGGPSWFDCEQEAISTFMVEGSGSWYDWTVELSDPEIKTLGGTTWGFNVGADVTYLFTKNIGVGGMVRYSGASLDVENALSAERDDGSLAKTVNLDLGGVQVLGGIRIRF
jgi:hypothetical protein